MKDIFVDNNVAKNFCNPMDKDYKALIEWLLSDGALAVSQKLLGEYAASTSHSKSASNIGVIVATLTAAGRLNRISKSQLDGLVLSKAHQKKIRSNYKDRPHLKTVMLSNRRLALSIDANFCFDVVNFPRFSARAAMRPEKLPYDK